MCMCMCIQVPCLRNSVGVGVGVGVGVRTRARMQYQELGIKRWEAAWGKVLQRVRLSKKDCTQEHQLT